MTALNIAVIPGDGIGVEVINEALKVAVAARVCLLAQQGGDAPAGRRVQRGCSIYLMSANWPRNFCVARKSVFLAVSSVVCKISPTVRSFNPW